MMSWLDGAALQPKQTRAGTSSASITCTALTEDMTQTSESGQSHAALKFEVRRMRFAQAEGAVVPCSTAVLAKDN